MVLGHQGGQRFKHIERELKAINFFGVYGQVDVGPGRQLAQAPDARHQLGHHTLALRVLIARVQRAELDGDAVVFLRRARGVCANSDSLDGIRVARQVAQRVGVGARALAQHERHPAQNL